MRIRFTRHARFKISLINEHGFLITTNHVRDAIGQPEFITAEKSGRTGAYRSLDKMHAIRVIYGGARRYLYCDHRNGGQEDEI